MEAWQKQMAKIGRLKEDRDRTDRAVSDATKKTRRREPEGIK